MLRPDPGSDLLGGVSAGLRGRLCSLGGQLPLGEAVSVHVANELYHRLHVLQGHLGTGACRARHWGVLGRGWSWLGAQAGLPWLLILLGREPGTQGGQWLQAPIWGTGFSLEAGRHGDEVLMQFCTTPALRLHCGDLLFLGAVRLGRERDHSEEEGPHCSPPLPHQEATG